MQKRTLDQFQALPVRGWAVSASFFHCCQDSSQNAATVPWKPKLCSETPERLQLTSSLSSLLPTSTSCQPCEGAVLDVIPVGPLDNSSPRHRLTTVGKSPSKDCLAEGSHTTIIRGNNILLFQVTTFWVIRYVATESQSCWKTVDIIHLRSSDLGV